MDRTLLIDGVPVSEYELYYKELPTIPTAEQDIEQIEIKGRDGYLTKKYGFKNISYPIELYFYENVSFRKAFRLVKPFLFNAETISFADDDEVYYKVKSVQIDTAETNIYKFGMFTVVFDLDPFQYEFDNEPITVLSRKIITNEGHKTLPIITAQVSGTGKIYINDQEITINNVNGSITIDSMMQNAYRQASTGLITENMNKHMIGEFPVLGHGDNIVSFDGDISELEVISNRRWV